VNKALGKNMLNFPLKKATEVAVNLIMEVFEK
jgi:hypothetical protein